MGDIDTLSENVNFTVIPHRALLENRKFDSTPR